MLTHESWDFYYRTVARWAPSTENEQRFYLRAMQQNFRPGMVWLDAGCGHSLVPSWLKGGSVVEEQFLKESKLLVGCDVDMPSLAKPSRIKRVGGNLEHLPFQDESFDFITCNMVVEHLGHPGRVFHEFYRVSKPEETVIILTPNLLHWINLVSWATPHWFHKLVRAKAWGSNPGDVFPTRYRSNTVKSLQKELSVSGFGEVTVHTIPGVPRLVGFGPILYLECLVFRVASKFPKMHEVLCAVAKKRRMS